MNSTNEKDAVPPVMESSYSRVIFIDVPRTYPSNTDVICHYSLTDALQPSQKDWIGVFKVGWSSTQKYHNYEWVPHPNQSRQESDVQQVVFGGNYLPKDDGEFYQFCYVDCNGSVKGASTPFCFRNPADTDLNCSLDTDILVITTHEQTEAMEKEIEALKEAKNILDKELEERLHEISILKEQAEKMQHENEFVNEAKNLLKNELDERLREIFILKRSMEDAKCNSETSLSDMQGSYTAEGSHQEKYEKAVQKIHKLKEQKAELQQQVESQEAEVLKLSTSMKEAEEKNSQLRDQLKLLEMDVLGSRKENDKLQEEFKELKIKISQKDLTKVEKADTSPSLPEDSTQIKNQALLTQLTEARCLLRKEILNSKEAKKRQENAEQELKEAKRRNEELNMCKAEDEETRQIQVQLHQAQEKIYDMAETSRAEREKLTKKNEDLQTEVNRLRQALLEYQVASVAAMSEQVTKPQSTQRPPHSPIYHNQTIDHFQDPAASEMKILVCQYCQEGFPGISEEELAEHQESHKVCPFCSLICDDWQQQAFEDHVYSHE